MTVRSPSYIESTSMIRNLSSRFSHSGEGYIVYIVILCAILFGIWQYNPPSDLQVGESRLRSSAKYSQAYWKRIICYSILFVIIIYGLQYI